MEGNAIDLYVLAAGLFWLIVGTVAGGIAITVLWALVELVHAVNKARKGAS